MNAKRGYVPEDENNFSPEAKEKLKTAARHIVYLLDEGYDLKRAAAFVGNHFLLSARQRLALMRSVASHSQAALRKSKEAALEEVKGREVWIDGFNLIITLEVMLSASPLFIGMDGAIRDLAALRGTYRLIPETAGAIDLMLCVLKGAGAGQIRVLLDEPVSNSGRLKTLIAERAEQMDPDGLDVRILRDVDRELRKKELVVTSDSVILDNCVSWVNLARECRDRMDPKEMAEMIRFF